MLGSWSILSAQCSSASKTGLPFLSSVSGSPARETSMRTHRTSATFQSHPPFRRFLISNLCEPCFFVVPLPFMWPWCEAITACLASLQVVNQCQPQEPKNLGLQLRLLPMTGVLASLTGSLNLLRQKTFAHNMKRSRLRFESQKQACHHRQPLAARVELCALAGHHFRQGSDWVVESDGHISSENAERH